jgi:hypothetical protein
MGARFYDSYIDPSGHGICDTPGGGPDNPDCQARQEDQSPTLEEILIETLQGMEDVIFDPARIDPIVIPLDDGTTLVIMPVGSDPFEKRSPSQKRGGEILGTLGAITDLFEFCGIVAGSMADLGAVGDIGVAAIGSALSGDMWFGGRPHPDLPPLVLFGQDVIVATGDLALPWITGGTTAGLTGHPEIGLVVKAATDAATTVATGVYDLARSRGSFPTVVNAGFSWQWPPQGYVLVYPGGNQEP